MKIIKYILTALLTISEWGALVIFIFYCGVWGQMTHSETMPFTAKELETIIPVFIVLWIVFSIINGLRDGRWKRQADKLETTTT